MFKKINIQLLVLLKFTIPMRLRFTIEADPTTYLFPLCKQ